MKRQADGFNVVECPVIPLHTWSQPPDVNTVIQTQVVMLLKDRKPVLPEDLKFSLVKNFPFPLKFTALPLPFTKR